MKYKNVVMIDEILICACSSDEHQIILHKDEEDKVVYCTIHLVKLSFWNRLLAAIKYVFGYKCKYGNFEEIILDKRHVNKLENLVNFLKDEE